MRTHRTHRKRDRTLADVSSPRLCRPVLLPYPTTSGAERAPERKVEVKLPIDTTGMTFLAAGPPEPVLDFESKAPKVDENGAPLHSVQVVALNDGGAEVISVKVAGQPKGVSQGSTVKIAGLVATPWTMGDRSGVAYRAEHVEPTSASRSAS